MKEELRRLCKALRLGYVMDHYASQPFESREQFLLAVLRAEKEQRELAKVRRLLKKARFHQIKTLENYTFESITFPPSLTQHALCSLEFVHKRQNILMLGGVGTGKTHLATALGVAACREGYNVRFFRVADLVAQLQQRHHTGTLARFKKDMERCDLLILDELGFVPFHQDGAELLFHLIADCYERNSIIVTSNLEFGQWTRVFGDSRLTAALVDRLVHHAHILAFTGESYRLRHALSGPENAWQG
ncbi:MULTISPECIES: IS21-like element helper ATPase IstB [Bacillales]|mgnify:CR=1 FL=1|uniref:IS21-like element helper ATPase IstB n=2 Tax=Brevibacillus aydinogluensis TaxID=927786 RepID=A0AA48RH35_9BACL|nr:MULTISPECIES: IS21-like element helper ATPase IstB [Bacillales]MBR8661812.1 IS21-like element helper ATPase IstB [Brevibacillus sp. NL20B1]REK62438.1 MAG: ATP-binding protein [Brevibacillus sp.]MBS2773209.1 IS21-like element helper ATPase IstB [Anoxybacillus rupiensis]CAJ1001072.1 IS21-like element helper ATPase IstB [Brevibacillus aydinogluensis]CAJ1001231.1 IS21-like element helper ATPase IstB [Brevibacillus aydinogluensis]